MLIERDSFIIECDKNIDYIVEVIDYLENKMNEIMKFFELSSLSNKKKVIVYTSIEKYKNHLEKYTNYREYLCADTYDGNINLLSLEEAHKTKSHKNMTIDNLKNIISHEFVHICQKESQRENNVSITWFWESLATNLGNPTDFKKIEIKVTNEEIENFNYLDNNYPIAFTIGAYLLENLSHKEILEYVKYPSKLLNNSKKILNSARKWSKI